MKRDGNNLPQERFYRFRRIFIDFDKNGKSVKHYHQKEFINIKLKLNTNKLDNMGGTILTPRDNRSHVDRSWAVPVSARAVWDNSRGRNIKPIEKQDSHSAIKPMKN